MAPKSIAVSVGAVETSAAPSAGGEPRRRRTA